MKKQDVIAEETETVVVRKADDLDLATNQVAEALYAKYCEVINPRHPIPLPSWLQLEELYKDAWRAVASLLEELYKDAWRAVASL